MIHHVHKGPLQPIFIVRLHNEPVSL